MAGPFIVVGIVSSPVPAQHSVFAKSGYLLRNGRGVFSTLYSGMTKYVGQVKAA
jgi:hypothetical protein